VAFCFTDVTETVTTTEWSFVTDSAGPDASTDEGMVQALFDVSAIASGDQYVFRVYEKAQSGGTQREITPAIVLTGPQVSSLFIPAFIMKYGWDFTVTKLAGTDRSISGSIRRVT
jgi:hypothetical protein